MNDPYSNDESKPFDWDKLKDDKVFRQNLSQCFQLRRQKIAASQDRFVQMAEEGKLIEGDRVRFGLRQLQRMEQGQFDELRLETFLTLIRCLGVSVEALFEEADYPIDKQSVPKIGITKTRSLMGETFSIVLKEGGRARQLRILPNPDRHHLRFLTWQTFGEGIQILVDQILNAGYHLELDACFGINDAGLVMATFLNYAALKRVRLGYVRCGTYKHKPHIDREMSNFPRLSTDPAIMLCDFEVKHAPVLAVVAAELRRRYGNPTLYFAVFGAMTESKDLRIKSIDELVCAKNLAKLHLQEVFIACTMHPPGIEPPLRLK